MKTKITFLSIGFAILIFLPSCFSPQNIVKLQPENEMVKWRYGQQFTSDSINGVVYDVGFERCENNQYWFNIMVKNNSNLPVMVDPENFYLKAFNKEKKDIDEGYEVAINPENEILEIEKSISRAKNREANHVGLSLLAAGVDIATGIAAITDENPFNDNERTHLFHEVQIAREANAFRTGDLKELKQTWENTTLRKTTLDPNYIIEGKVFFPAKRDASFIQLLLPVDENFIKINYKQIQIPVK